MIIDAHSHMLSTECLNKLADKGGTWAKEAVHERLHANIRKPYYSNVTLRVEQLDKYGIDFQVVTPNHALDSNLMPGDIAAQVDYARIINDGMARLMEESK